MYRTRHLIHITYTLVLCLWLSGCETLTNTLQEPDVKVLDVQLSKSLSNPGFTTQLEITNPNTFALNIAGIYYELEINGKAIASGTNAQNIAIAANNAATTDFFTEVNLFEGIALFNSLKRSSTAPTYKLKAKLQLQGWPLPITINRSGQIDLDTLAR